MLSPLHLSVSVLPLPPTKKKEIPKSSHDKTKKNYSMLQNTSPVFFKTVNVTIKKESLRYCHKPMEIKKI